VKANKKWMALLLVALLFMTGCSQWEAFQIRQGWKNTDFEFLKSPDISSIIIQSTRDPGFRFVVTDRTTILGLYESLSSAKAAEAIIVHDADYIFEIHDLDGHVQSYHYVAGMSDQNRANFYNEEGQYIVTDRIDNHLIQNLYTIRKPRYFERVYYGSLLDLIKVVKEEYNGKSIGVRFSGDGEALKYQLSRDIENFREKALKEGVLVLSPGEKADVVLDIKTQGYTTTVYKAVVTAQDLSRGSKKEYYIWGTYVNEVTGWNILIQDTKWDDF